MENNTLPNPYTKCTVVKHDVTGRTYSYKNKFWLTSLQKVYGLFFNARDVSIVEMVSQIKQNSITKIIISNSSVFILNSIKVAFDWVTVWLLNRDHKSIASW